MKVQDSIWLDGDVVLPFGQQIVKIIKYGETSGRQSQTIARRYDARRYVDAPLHFALLCKKIDRVK